MKKKNTHQKTMYACHRLRIGDRSVKLATSSQLLVTGYLIWRKLATSSQLLVTGYMIWRKLATWTQLR